MYHEVDESLREVDFGSRITETLKRFGYNYQSQDPIVIRAIDAFIEVFIEDARIEDYVHPLLEHLKKKYKLGLISNFAYPKGFWKTLDHFDLTKFFDAIVVSGELGVRKPSPKIFEKALELLNVKASETVFVGDTLKDDIVGARKVGIKTILVENIGLKKTNYENQEDETPSVKPDKKIPSLKELMNALKTYE
jgi:putative hydrolase of the HAD superfamily